MIWYYQFPKYFFWWNNFGWKVCIGDIYIRKYIPKYIKPMSNRNNITRGCKTCISSMLLQLDLNEWRLSKLAKLDKLYINSASTRLLQRSNNDFIEYNNQKLPNNSCIHLRACDAASSYNFPSPITGSNIQNGDVLLTVVLIVQGLMLHI